MTNYIDKNKKIYNPKFYLYRYLIKVKNNNKFIRYNDWLDKEMSKNNE